MIAWGLAPIGTRYLVLRIPPLPLITIRFLIAALLFLPLCIPLLRHLKASEWTRLLPAALLGVVGYYVPVTYGLQRVPASTAGIILATEPAWILLAARFLGHERVRRANWFGVAIAFIGVALLVLTTSASGGKQEDLLGDALLILAAILFAAYTIYVRRLSYEHGSLPATAITMVVGTVPLLPLVVLINPASVADAGPAAVIALLLLAIGSTVVGTLLWNYGVHAIGGGEAGPFMNGIPLVTVLGGYLLLAERPSVATLVSGALIVGGIAGPQVMRRREARDQSVRR